jgi:translocator protein
MKLVASSIGVALVLIYVVGSGLWVNTGDGWYRGLNQPSWQPPDFIFGIIWPYNFIALGFAAVIVSNRLSTALVATYLTVFAISVACALTWAYQFYRPHNLEAASTALTCRGIANDSTSCYCVPCFLAFGSCTIAVPTMGFNR